MYGGGRDREFGIIDHDDRSTQLGWERSSRRPDTGRVGNIWYGSAAEPGHDAEERLFSRVQDGNRLPLFEFPIEHRVDMLTEGKDAESPLFYLLGTDEESSLWAVDGGVSPQQIRESTHDVDWWINTSAGFIFSDASGIWGSDGTPQGTVQIEVEGFDRIEQVRKSGEQSFLVAQPNEGSIQIWNAEVKSDFDLEVETGFTVPEGEGFRLSMRVVGSTENLIYSLDIDNDGEFDDRSDELGPHGFASEEVEWPELRQVAGTSGAWPIGIRVTDDSGESVTKTTFVFIENKPPVVEDVIYPAVLPGDDQPWGVHAQRFRCR